MHMQTWGHFSFSCDVSLTPVQLLHLQGSHSQRWRRAKVKNFAWVISPVLWWCHSQFTARQERNLAFTRAFSYTCCCLIKAFSCSSRLSPNINKDALFSVGAPVSPAQSIACDWHHKVWQTQWYTSDFIFLYLLTELLGGLKGCCHIHRALGESHLCLDVLGAVA